MSGAAPAVLSPLTFGAYSLYQGQQDAKRRANDQINQEKDQADKAAADLLARKKADEARRAMMGGLAQKSLMSGFNRSSTYGGTLLTSGGTGGQSTILGA